MLALPAAFVSLKMKFILLRLFLLPCIIYHVEFDTNSVAKKANYET